MDAQSCDPQLVRTLTTDGEDNFVARRHVHPHLKIALERTNQTVRLLRASINTDRRQLAPNPFARVAQEEEPRIVARPREGSKRAVVRRRQRSASAALALTYEDFVTA